MTDKIETINIREYRRFCHIPERDTKYEVTAIAIREDGRMCVFCEQGLDAVPPPYTELENHFCVDMDWAAEHGQFFTAVSAEDDEAWTTDKELVARAFIELEHQAKRKR